MCKPSSFNKFSESRKSFSKGMLALNGCFESDTDVENLSEVLRETSGCSDVIAEDNVLASNRNKTTKLPLIVI